MKADKIFDKMPYFFQEELGIDKDYTKAISCIELLQRAHSATCIEFLCNVILDHAGTLEIKRNAITDYLQWYASKVLVSSEAFETLRHSKIDVDSNSNILRDQLELLICNNVVFKYYKNKIGEERDNAHFQAASQFRRIVLKYLKD